MGIKKTTEALTCQRQPYDSQVKVSSQCDNSVTLVMSLCFLFVHAGVQSTAPFRLVGMCMCRIIIMPSPKPCTFRDKKQKPIQVWIALSLYLKSPGCLCYVCVYVWDSLVFAQVTKIALANPLGFNSCHHTLYHLSHEGGTKSGSFIRRGHESKRKWLIWRY